MTPLRGGTLFSGIGAPEQAMPEIDWRWRAEIDPFANAVAEARHPHIPNLGNVLEIDPDAVEPVDLLVFGSPCQAFSIAGKRGGLDDPRGNLTLVGFGLAGRIRPRWVVWENVPGVLSDDGGRTFGTVLGLLGQLGYGFAYGVLDAQFFGVPQRRRRVFVVGHLGDWRPAAAVLLEPESLSGNPPPRREAREGVAVSPTLRAGGNSTGGHRPPSTDVDTADSLIAFGGNNTAGPLEVATAVRAKGGSGHGDFESETFIAHSLRADGFDASEVGTGRGTPLVPVAFDTTQITSKANRCRPEAGAPCHPLAASAHAPAIAFDCKAGAETGFAIGDVPGPLRGEGHGGGHAAVAFDLRGREGGAQFEGPHETANVRASNGGSSRSYVAASAVRRLTPRECERLQGFPDNYTLVTYRGKPAADGPRYRALGNSMAVPVMRWLLSRIVICDGALREIGRAA